MILGVEDVKNENGDNNFPMELQAATTEGYSMHIGIIYFFLLITKVGTMARGRERTPITFSIMVSAISRERPPP